MDTSFRPMLAENADLSKLKYPLIVSPKLDGVRATFVDGKLLTRSLKPIPNRRIQQMFQCTAPLDGELIVGDPTSPSVFRDTMKVVSTHDTDISDVRFFIFDIVDNAMQFNDRLALAFKLLTTSPPELYIGVPHALIENETQLLNREDDTLKQGFEGLMIRSTTGPYKFGRSTVSEGYLLKLKRKLIGEAEIIGFEEQMHNANEATVNNLGYTERSSHQAGMVPTGMLGALVVKDKLTNVQFNIGTGFDAGDRLLIWEDREEYLGRICSYEYLPYGVKDKPRHPVFKGFRMKEDM